MLVCLRRLPEGRRICLCRDVAITNIQLGSIAGLLRQLGVLCPAISEAATKRGGTWFQSLAAIFVGLPPSDAGASAAGKPGIRICTFQITWRSGSHTPTGGIEAAAAKSNAITIQTP